MRFKLIIVILFIAVSIIVIYCFGSKERLDLLHDYGVFLVGIAAFIALFQTGNVLDKILRIEEALDKLKASNTELEEGVSKIHVAVSSLERSESSIKSSYENNAIIVKSFLEDKFINSIKDLGWNKGEFMREVEKFNNNISSRVDLDYDSMWESYTSLRIPKQKPILEKRKGKDEKMMKEKSFKNTP